MTIYDPGPWRLCSHNGVPCPCGLVWSIRHDTPVATVHRITEGGDWTTAAWAANGRLIAAGPEMLGTFRSMVAKRSAALAEYPEIVPLLASIDGPP